MSGHSVLIPVVQPSVLIPTSIGLGAGLAALGLAASVKLLVDSRIQAAEEERSKEMAANTAWLAYVASEMEKTALYAALEQAVQESEQKLQHLELALAGADRALAAGAEGGPPPMHDYATIGATRLTPEQMASLVEELNRVLDELPAEFRETERSSYPALARQAKQFAKDLRDGGRVRTEEVAEFRKLMASALGSFADDIKTAEEFRQEFNQRLDGALNEVIFYQKMAPAQFLPDLVSLRQQIVGLLGASEVRRGQLELVERKFAELRKAVDAEVIRIANRDGLCESILKNLHEMGYDIIEEFTSERAGQLREATVRVPGGELVQMGLHPNNQLGMQLIHERKAGKTGPVSLDELQHIRTQEKRWCSDFKQLVRNLVAEGFPYEIKFEDIVPDQSVKVVVVETAEDILAKEAEQSMHLDDQAPQRYMDQ